MLKKYTKIIKKFASIALVMVLGLTAFTGCDASIIIDSSALQVETTLIQMMDGLLHYFVYNAMDIPNPDSSSSTLSSLL